MRTDDDGDDFKWNLKLPVEFRDAIFIIHNLVPLAALSFAGLIQFAQDVCALYIYTYVENMGL